MTRHARGSDSASVAVTAPDTAPSVGTGAALVYEATGAVLLGEMATVTGTVTVPPKPSSTTTLRVSVVGPLPAAWWRAAAVGV